MPTLRGHDESMKYGVRVNFASMLLTYSHVWHVACMPRGVGQWIRMRGMGDGRRRRMGMAVRNPKIKCDSRCLLILDPLPLSP